MIFELSEYMIRRKFSSVFAAGLHIYDRVGNIVGFGKQQFFKFKEDIRVYSDRSAAKELLRIKARQKSFNWMVYDIVDARQSRKVGAFQLKRTKIASVFPWLSWEFLDEDDRPMSKFRIFPSKIIVLGEDLGRAAGLRERYGPSTRELVVRIQPGAALDRGLVLGFAVLVAGAMRWKR